MAAAPCARKFIRSTLNFAPRNIFYKLINVIRVTKPAPSVFANTTISASEVGHFYDGDIVIRKLSIGLL